MILNAVMGNYEPTDPAKLRVIFEASTDDNPKATDDGTINSPTIEASTDDNPKATDDGLRSILIDISNVMAKTTYEAIAKNFDTHVDKDTSLKILDELYDKASTNDTFKSTDDGTGDA
jgi:hypothetical protein